MREVNRLLKNARPGFKQEGARLFCDVCIVSALVSQLPHIKQAQCRTFFTEQRTHQETNSAKRC